MAAMALWESGFTVSATPITPAKVPSTAASMAVLPSASRLLTSASISSILIPLSSMSLRLPTSKRRPSTTALIPCPGMAAKSFGSPRSSPCFLAPAIMASPKGCSEPLSALAVSLSTSSSVNPLNAAKSVSSGSPLVIVPVLSKTMAWSLWAFSKCSPPLMRMPFSAPLPVPTMIEVGVASPKAQGQAITKTAVMLISALVKLPGAPMKYQPRKVKAATPTTTGTNLLEIISAIL